MSKLFVKGKSYVELKDSDLYTKSGKSILTYYKPVSKQTKDTLKKDGYRKATKKEVESSKVVTESKLKNLGYELATEEQVKIFLESSYNQTVEISQDQKSEEE